MPLRACARRTRPALSCPQSPSRSTAPCRPTRLPRVRPAWRQRGGCRVRVLRRSCGRCHCCWRCRVRARGCGRGRRRGSGARAQRDEVVLTWAEVPRRSREGPWQEDSGEGRCWRWQPSRGRMRGPRRRVAWWRRSLSSTSLQTRRARFRRARVLRRTARPCTSCVAAVRKLCWGPLRWSALCVRQPPQAASWRPPSQRTASRACGLRRARVLRFPPAWHTRRDAGIHARACVVRHSADACPKCRGGRRRGGRGHPIAQARRWTRARAAAAAAAGAAGGRR